MHQDCGTCQPCQSLRCMLSDPARHRTEREWDRADTFRFQPANVTLEIHCLILRSDTFGCGSILPIGASSYEIRLVLRGRLRLPVNNEQKRHTTVAQRQLQRSSPNCSLGSALRHWQGELGSVTWPWVVGTADSKRELCKMPGAGRTPCGKYA